MFHKIPSCDVLVMHSDSAKAPYPPVDSPTATFPGMVRDWRGQAVPFLLTLTLSRREREQRASRSGKPTGLDCSPRRGGFTLSPRERAGVRGKNPPHRAVQISWPWRKAYARSATWL